MAWRARRHRRRRGGRGLALVSAALLTGALAAFALTGPSSGPAQETALPAAGAAVIAVPPPPAVVPEPALPEETVAPRAAAVTPAATPDRSARAGAFRGIDAAVPPAALEVPTRPPCVETVNGVTIVRGRACAPIRR